MIFGAGHHLKTLLCISHIRRLWISGCQNLQTSYPPIGNGKGRVAWRPRLPNKTMQEKQVPQQNQGRCCDSNSITGAVLLISFLFMILINGILVFCFGYVPNSTASLVPNMLPGHSMQRATRPCSCHVERRPQVASDDDLL